MGMGGSTIQYEKLDLHWHVLQWMGPRVVVVQLQGRVGSTFSVLQGDRFVKNVLATRSHISLRSAMVINRLAMVVSKVAKMN